MDERPPQTIIELFSFVFNRFLIGLNFFFAMDGKPILLPY
jgi:hypothetical protein